MNNRPSGLQNKGYYERLRRIFIHEKGINSLRGWSTPKYACPNNRASKHMKHKRTRLEGDTDKSTVEL